MCIHTYTSQSHAPVSLPGVGLGVGLVLDWVDGASLGFFSGPLSVVGVEGSAGVDGGLTGVGLAGLTGAEGVLGGIDGVGTPEPGSVPVPGPCADLSMAVSITSRACTTCACTSGEPPNSSCTVTIGSTATGAGVCVGDCVGACVGSLVGLAVGDAVGDAVGAGVSVCCGVGAGVVEGAAVGMVVGARVGTAVGPAVGDADGVRVKSKL